MRHAITCPLVRRRFSAHLAGNLPRAESAEIQNHLRSCTSCRAELGSYFPLDLWEEGGIPAERDSAGLAASVLARLDGSERISADSAAIRLRSTGRRQLFWNYLAASLATLFLLYTNCFEFVADTDRLGRGARSFSEGARRMVEIRPDWRAIRAWLRALGGTVVKPGERR